MAVVRKRVIRTVACDEVSYVCDRCGKSYGSRDELIAHLKDEFEADAPPMFKVGDFFRLEGEAVYLITGVGLREKYAGGMCPLDEDEIPVIVRTYYVDHMTVLSGDGQCGMDEAYLARNATRLFDSAQVQEYVSGLLKGVGLMGPDGYGFSMDDDYDSDDKEMTVRIRIGDVIESMARNGMIQKGETK